MTSTRETARSCCPPQRERLSEAGRADLIADHGGAVDALEYVLTHRTDVLQLFDVGRHEVDETLNLDAIEAEVRAWSQEGMAITTILDPEYPGNLHAIHNRPPMLFVRGAPDLR